MIQSASKGNMQGFRKWINTTDDSDAVLLNINLISAIAGENYEEALVIRNQLNQRPLKKTT